MSRLRNEYRQMSKPRAVEGVGDLYLIRPLGFLIAQVLRHTPLTPTMVSTLAVLAGWGAAWFYYLSDSAGGVPGLAVAAALALLLHSALDSADGQLARLTGRTSELGRIVDGFCDSLAFLGIYVAIVAAYWVRADGQVILVALLAVAAAWSHAVQSSLVEYQRTLYLFAVHGRRDMADAARDAAAAEAGEGKGVAGFLQKLHARYYRRQQTFLPTTARLEKYVLAWAEAHPGKKDKLAAAYDRCQRPGLPGWTLLASNIHKAGIAVAAFLPVADGSFWSGLGMSWYLLFDLALNFAMAVLIVRQRSRDERTMAAVEAIESS